MKSMKKETKREIKEFTDCRGKHGLVLKILNILISLSISEGTLIDDTLVMNLRNEFDELFRVMEEDMKLSISNTMQATLINKLLSNVKKLNNQLAKEILKAFNEYANFLKNKTNIDNLLDKIITTFKSSIDYIMKNNPKKVSKEIINGFYKYLDGFSLSIKKVKEITSQKKSQREEQKIKKNEEIEAEYKSTIEKLKKIIEEKENDLSKAYEKSIRLSLDLDSFRRDNQALIKTVNDSRSIIKKKDEDIKDYKKTIERMEKMYVSNTEAIKSLQERVKTLEITDIQNSHKIKNLSEENQFLKKKIEDLEKNIKALESENELKDKRNKAEISNILKICRNNFRELRTHIAELEEDRLFFYNNYINLANEFNNVVIDYNNFITEQLLQNPEMINEDDEDFFNYDFDINNPNGP